MDVFKSVVAADASCQQFDGNVRYRMIYIASTTVNRRPNSVL